MALKEQHELRNRMGVFSDRFDAGNQLAALLEKYRRVNDGLVLAIPSGGVPVGLAVSNVLELDLDVVIARKLQIPGNTEAGFGALALEGGRFLNSELLTRLGLTPAQVEEETAKVAGELERRNQALRGGRPLPELTGRTVIIADDGLASGFTMLAAVDAIRAKNPREVICAVPTAPLSSIKRVEETVEMVVCANVHDSGPFAVAGAYRAWRDLETAEVKALLAA